MNAVSKMCLLPSLTLIYSIIADMVTLAKFEDWVMKSFSVVSYHCWLWRSAEIQKLIDEEDTLIELCYLGTWNYLLQNMQCFFKTNFGYIYIYIERERERWGTLASYFYLFDLKLISMWWDPSPYGILVKIIVTTIIWSL